ncbi:hypothetical protein M569_05033 [Genlisea aurea]|uniref:Myb/SANT-like domain-containing protein n=1 Tax=Genlisea aurea TaxID=192259 RepID=S8E224_9LAMI|nr:hypothetical protein M569_05033 [Genlisea aurea]
MRNAANEVECSEINGTKRPWTAEEEAHLITAYKRIIATGWKAKPGFRPGYMKQLEKEMHALIPGTDILASDKRMVALRYKPFPLFHDWEEIFGRDSATGEFAVGCNEFAAKENPKTMQET